MAWRYLFGIFVLVLAAGFLAQQMGPVQGNALWFVALLAAWWPLFVIAIGLNQLFRRMERPWGSLAIIAVSMLVLVWTTDNRPHDLAGWVTVVVAILVLMLGLRMMLPRRMRKLESRTTISSGGGRSLRFAHTLKEFQVFGGVQFHNESQQFQGGNLRTVFGEYEVDLRGAALSRGGADLQLTAVFGNIVLRVPEEMTVQISGTPVFGNIDNNAKQIVPVEAGRPVLRLKCQAIVSAIEITN